MPTDHDIPKLIINKVPTKAQYDQMVKNADELYLIPDDSQGLPDQTGQSGKYLKTDGTDASWESVPAGTVTSVRVQAGTGLASSQSTAQSTTLNTTISIASGYKLPTTTEWGNKQDVISDLSTIRDGASAGATAVQPGDLATVATTGAYSDLSGTPSLSTVAISGSYNDLSNKPTIPTVNDAVLTIQKNGATVSTFTANSATNAVANITVPTKVSDLTNDSGYITGITAKNVTTALGYTPYDSTNPSGYISGITANNVTVALGYTPYNSTNPNGYTSNTGTVKSVQVQAGTGLTSSTSTAQNTTLNTTISIASGYKLPTTTEWSGKQDALTTQTAYTSKGTATKVPQITTNTLGQVTNITEVTITQPTVNNSTITIQKNSTTVDSFTLNQSSGKTINISVPTKVSDLNNDSGFITGITANNVTTALGYTPYNSTNPNGYITSADIPTIKNLNTNNTTGQTASASESLTGTGTVNLHKVSKTGSYNDLLNKPTIPTVNNATVTIQKNSTNVGSFTLNQSGNATVNITVPTKLSEFTDDLGSSPTHTHSQYLTSHQSIKTLNTTNTTAQSTSASEAITGTGTLNLHKISKTGTFNDLISKPTSISGYGITDAYTKTEVDGLISSVYKPAGSVAFASLPTLASGVLGNVYNVTDAFTTDTRFVEGSGKSYPAGTNVVVVEPTSGTYKFDVLAGFVDLSGYVPTTRKVNNKALSADITLSASDVGALPDSTIIPQGTVKSVQVQAGTGLTSSTSTAQNTTLSTTISIASGYKLPTTTEWGNKQDALATQTAYTSKGSATKVPQITTNTLGQVTGITEVTITQPTVNNAVLTIQKNSATISTFSANASSNVTCNIAVPTKVSELTNDSGYTTNTGTVTSVRVQAGTGLSSSTSTAQNTTLNTTISIASGYKLPTTTEWNSKQDALPAQSGNTGKFLTTNGSTLSWATVSTGTSDYSSLTNKPSINSVTLSGNKTSSDLGLQPALATQTVYSAKGSATKVPQITTNNLGQVTSITEVTITQPTVNNATLSLQKNGTTVATFRANSASNVTCNITVPTTVAELSDSSNYIQTSELVELATVATSGSYNDLTNKPTIPQGTVTSVRVQAASPVVSSTSTSQSTSLNTTISLADGYGDTKNPYASKTKNYVLAAPSTTNGVPTFRALTKADIPLASETAASGGTTTSLVTTGEKYTWNNKQNALTTQTAYSAKGSATKVPQITTNTLGQVTGITEVDITHPTELPSQSGQSGKYLTTNGTTASWGTVSIPTVNNSTITIQKNGTNVDSFTTNAASGKSINITLAKGDVGLGNVDNTADLDKPISTATQTALDAKQNTISDLGYIRNQVAKVDDKISGIDITDSGDSLPAASGYNLNDTFLNKTDKKLYKVEAPAYALNSSVSKSDAITVNLTTGLATGFSTTSNPGGTWTTYMSNSYNTRIATTPIYVHFKTGSTLPAYNKYIFINYTPVTYYSTYFGVAGSTTLSLICTRYITSTGQIESVFNYPLFDTVLEANTEYYLYLEYNNGEYIATLSSTGYNINIIETSSIEESTTPGCTTFYYGGPNNRYTTFNGMSVYLLDSTGNFLVADGELTWDSGTTLEDNTQYNDITNEKTIYYNNAIIYEGGSVAVDSSTITLNSSNQIQTVGYKDVRTSNTLKTWTGTRAQYDAIVTKDANTLYNITDDTDTTAAMLELLYPVGAVYIGTMDVCPLASLGIGSWEKIAEDQVLQGSSSNHNAGATIAAGLPNITGSIWDIAGKSNSTDGAFTYEAATQKADLSSGSSVGNGMLYFDASDSNSIYGNSNTVQPPAFVVNIWRRIS